MSVSNKAGTLVAVMGANEYGGAEFLYNKDGNAVAGMVVGEDGNGGIIVSNKDGKVIGSLP